MVGSGEGYHYSVGTVSSTIVGEYISSVGTTSSTSVGGYQYRRNTRSTSGPLVLLVF